MLPGLSVPPSLERLLAGLRPGFTAPSFTTVCALVCGMLAQTGRRYFAVAYMGIPCQVGPTDATGFH